MSKIISFLMASWIGFAAQALTYDEALSLGAQNSHDLKILQLQSESAGWQQRKAYAGYLPTIDVDGRHLMNERFQELEVPFGGQTFVMPAIQPYSHLGVTAKWNVFNGFRSLNEVRAARQEKEAADYRILRAKEQMQAEVRALFYRALGSQILLEVADQNIQSLQSHLNDVQSRIRSGVSTRYDSLRVEVQLEDARTEKIAAENNIVVARAKLYEYLGVADEGKSLEGKLPEDFSRINLKNVSLQASERADRSALIADRDRLRSLSQAAKGHWLPAVSLFGNYEWYNNINHSISESDNRFKSAYALGVAFSWDLFDGGERYAQQQQTLLAQKVADENLSKFDQSAPVSLEDAKRRFSYDVINFNAKLASIHKAEEAVRLARGGVKAGTRTNTEVLDAVVDLNRARAAAVKSQVDAIEALGLLELSVGHSL